MFIKQDLQEIDHDRSGPWNLDWRLTSKCVPWRFCETRKECGSTPSGFASFDAINMWRNHAKSPMMDRVTKDWLKRLDKAASVIPLSSFLMHYWLLISQRAFQAVVEPCKIISNHGIMYLILGFLGDLRDSCFRPKKMELAPHAIPSLFRFYSHFFIFSPPSIIPFKSFIYIQY